MVDRFIANGKKLFTDPQESVFSAATAIMILLVVSRVLGLVRNTTLLQLFDANDVSLFFSAFRLPDTIFEVLVFGTFSSAFIPVFAKMVKQNKEEAWNIASTVANIGVLLFAVFAIIVGIFAGEIYSWIAPGYGENERITIVSITRILLVGQIFFVASYVLTGVLESMKRFIVPALAPICYNMGIILGTIFLSERVGLLAPAYGALFGAMFHFIIQLPLALHLGFRFRFGIKPNEHVKRIGRLAAPRLLETSFLQVSKMAELFLSSLISTASYGYYYLGNSLQAVPVGLFGLSIAKAAFPTLSEQSDNPKEFTKTLWKVINQVVFVTIPFAAMLIVLRIPVVRLVYGRELFDWQSTVQTSLVLSAFGVGIVFQCVVALLSRSFYALSDTKTPVIVSIGTILFITLTDFFLIRGLGFPVWGLAAAYSTGVGIQSCVLFYLVNKRLGTSLMKNALSLFKIILSAVVSGGSMYFLLKALDRSVWVKNIPLLGALRFPQNLPFDAFVLDTRYVTNLFILTCFVGFVGLLIYVLSAMFLKIPELHYFTRYLQRYYEKGRELVVGNAKPSPEPVSEDPTH
jgi:putative peptidoglycan lipid II flippase